MLCIALITWVVWLMLTFIEPDFPRLVSIIITPFCAAEPQRAAALGPLRIFKEAILSGLIADGLPIIGTPSMTYNGWLSPEIERFPRRITRLFAPTPVPPDAITNPGTFPCNEDITLISRASDNSSVLIL